MPSCISDEVIQNDIKQMPLSSISRAATEGMADAAIVSLSYYLPTSASKKEIFSRAFVQLISTLVCPPVKKYERDEQCTV
jgi:hypothetical protein